MGSKWDIEKFTGSNDFGLWKVKMKALLIHHKCVEALKGIAQMSATLSDEEKKDMDEKALSSIILCLGDKVLREVAKETSAAAMWMLMYKSKYRFIVSTGTDAISMPFNNQYNSK
ncbi:hypothetical protein QL285_002148 [Trifolium repens]|nr:hypothetical protein QL285_002148 [Trifolium repens]